MGTGRHRDRMAGKGTGTRGGEQRGVRERERENVGKEREEETVCLDPTILIAVFERGNELEL